MEVGSVAGPYGQAAVLVDGAVVAATGWSGWLPRTRVVLERVKAALAS